MNAREPTDRGMNVVEENLAARRETLFEESQGVERVVLAKEHQHAFGDHQARTVRDESERDPKSCGIGQAPFNERDPILRGEEPEFFAEHLDRQLRFPADAAEEDEINGAFHLLVMVGSCATEFNSSAAIARR